MDLHKIKGSISGTLVSTFHISVSIPRILVDKGFDLQLTNLSHKILPSNGTESRFHTNRKEIRFDTSTEIHFCRYGISDSTEFSQGISRLSKLSHSDIQNISFSDSSFGMNFPFSFGQTQCSSRLHSIRQTSFTTSANVSIISLETSHTSSR